MTRHIVHSLRNYDLRRKSICKCVILYLGAQLILSSNLVVIFESAQIYMTSKGKRMRGNRIHHFIHLLWACIKICILWSLPYQLFSVVLFICPLKVEQSSENVPSYKTFLLRSCDYISCEQYLFFYSHLTIPAYCSHHSAFCFNCS